MRSLALVEKSEELCACMSGIKAISRAMNQAQENPACLGIGGQDVDTSPVSLRMLCIAFPVAAAIACTLGRLEGDY